MSDQAASLRRMMAGTPAGAPPERSTAEAVVIGSAKGGVGKSVLSILVAAAMARAGRRTLLVDASHNQGNLHVLLGVRPRAGVEQLLAGEAEPADLLVEIEDRFALLPSASGAESLYGLSAVDRARMQRRLSSLYDRYDQVVVDPGPGLESVVRATMRTNRLVIVVTPEPAALSDAYALAKIVNMQVPSLRLSVLVNRAQEDEARNAAGCLQLAARRFLRREVEWIGAVPEDARVARVARTAGPVAADIPEAVTAVAACLDPPAVVADTNDEPAAAYPEPAPGGIEAW